MYLTDTQARYKYTWQVSLSFAPYIVPTARNIISIALELPAAKSEELLKEAESHLLHPIYGSLQVVLRDVQKLTCGTDSFH